MTVSLLVAFGPPERTTPAKWALVVGISDYTHFGDELGGDLPGAANDARAIADVLVNRYDFDPDNVKLVLDQAATRDRMVSELSEWLPSVARPGDLVWFYFAGHGSQAWDMDGDEQDGLDETVCPADVVRGSTDMDILDDEISVWLDQLPTDNVVVVWDKCHAKSSTRAATPFARPRSLDRDVRADVAKPAGATETRTAAGLEDGGGTGAAILEIAAAQDDEVAIDATFPSRDGGEPTHGGAFTTAFVQNLWNAPEGATYSDIFVRTREDMRRNRFRQQPHLDEKAMKDRPLFWVEDSDGSLAAGGADAGPKGSVRIIGAPSQAGVQLSGGASADMTPRSIYRAGDRLLEVLEVEGARATARVLPAPGAPGNGSSADLSPGSAAHLTAYHYPDAVLRVMVTDAPDATRRALRSELASATSLMLVDDESSFAHLIVRPRNGHLVVMNLDGFPRDSVVAEPSAGRAAADLARLLRQESGQYQLAQLENPGQAFELDFAFGNGRTDFELGESISFLVTSERAGYLTIVDLAPDGTVSVIFPNEYVAENRVHAGRTMQFPAADSDLQFAAIEPVGRGIVRAFVTEEPLVMPFAQGADATEAARLWAALRNAAGAPAVDGSDAIPTGSWGTSAVVYEIRRP